MTKEKREDLVSKSFQIEEAEEVLKEQYLENILGEVTASQLALKQAMYSSAEAVVKPPIQYAEKDYVNLVAMGQLSGHLAEIASHYNKVSQVSDDSTHYYYVNEVSGMCICIDKEQVDGWVEINDSTEYDQIYI